MQSLPTINFAVGTYLIQDSKTVDTALEAGYRLFDSAKLYNNEKELGKAFEELLPKYGLNRDDIFITTKFSELNFQGRPLLFYFFLY